MQIKSSSTCSLPCSCLGVFLGFPSLFFVIKRFSLGLSTFSTVASEVWQDMEGSTVLSDQAKLLNASFSIMIDSTHKRNFKLALDLDESFSMPLHYCLLSHHHDSSNQLSNVSLMRPRKVDSVLRCLAVQMSAKSLNAQTQIELNLRFKCWSKLNSISGWNVPL